MAISDADSAPNQADRRKLGYVGRTPNGKNSQDSGSDTGDAKKNAPRKSNEWYTPQTYLDSVRAVLGGAIDLDPFSSPAANQGVRANRFYTVDDDAFEQNWAATTVFMNPPYSGQLVALATNKFMDEFKNRAFEGGIFLVNNATETKWFQRALYEAHAACFTNHRISFWNADGKAISGNTRGQTFFLFGEEFEPRFTKEFNKHGRVVRLDAVGMPQWLIAKNAGTAEAKKPGNSG